MGTIYDRLIIKSGIQAAVAKALKRSWFLYVLTVVLSLVAYVLVTRLNLDWNIYLTPTTWPDMVLGIVTTTRTYMFTDVMLLYTFLVLSAAPATALLARGYTKLLLAASWGLWAWWQLDPQSAQIPWPIIDNGLFHFAAWQVLFINGLVIGYHRRAIEARLARLNPLKVMLVAGAVFACAVFLFLTHLAPLSALGDQTTLAADWFDKSQVRFGRLVVFASFVLFTYSLLTVAWRPLRRALGWLLLPLGQDSLTAYTLHLFVMALLAKTLVPLLGPELNATTNALVQVTGILLIWAAVLAKPRLKLALTGLRERGQAALPPAEALPEPVKTAVGEIGDWARPTGAQTQQARPIFIMLDLTDQPTSLQVARQARSRNDDLRRRSYATVRQRRRHACLDC
jgi:hypothetical protein